MFLYSTYIITQCTHSLQRIPQFPPDSRTMQVFAKCDDFMSALLTTLGQEIMPFTLKRRACITMETWESGHTQVMVMGLDRDEDLPYSFIKVSICDELNHYSNSKILVFTLS